MKGEIQEEVQEEVPEKESDTKVEQEECEMVDMRAGLEENDCMQAGYGCMQVGNDCTTVENDCMKVVKNCMQVENECEVGFEEEVPMMG